MAKFGTWTDIGSLVRDLKRGIYRLSVEDNLPELKTLKPWDLQVWGELPMTVTSLSVEQNRYLKRGPVVEIFFRFKVTIGGTPGSRLFMSLPHGVSLNTGVTSLDSLDEDPLDGISRGYAGMATGYLDGGVTSLVGMLVFVRGKRQGILYNAEAGAFSSGVAEGAFSCSYLTDD